MSLELTSTCVGGRRAGLVQPISIAPKVKARSLISPAERRVLQAVIETGFCTLAAERLGLSVKTVEIHMLHMRQKTLCLSNYQLIAAFASGGIE